MKIPEETPKKPNNQDPKKAKNEKAPAQELSPELESAARIVASSAAGLVHSRAKLNMLSFLLHECKEGEISRSPEDSVERSHTEKNRAEKFLLDRSESPLQEAVEAKRYFEMLDNPIQSIDESDPRTKNLGEYLKEAAPEKFEELQRATEQLLKEDTINERIQEILLQSSPELLQDYQEYQEVIGGIAMEQNLNIILGEDADKKTQAEFRDILKEEESECKSWSMLEAEKARILCNALTLPKDSDRKTQLLEEAKRLLGEDTVKLVQAQVNHTNNSILNLYASEETPSNTPEELFCPEILERMGEGGPNKQQIKTLAEIQEFYLFRRGENPPSGEELSHQITRATLGALYVLEHGTWIGHTNTLKEYQEVKQSKKKEFEKFVENNRDRDPEKNLEPEESEKPEKNNIPGRNKKPSRYFDTQISKIEKIIDTYNEGVTSDEFQADKDKIIKGIRKLSGESKEGLLNLNTLDIEKTGAPKLLATQISTLFQKEAKKSVKGIFSRHMQSHMTKFQQKIFSKTYESLSEEILQKQGKTFGGNEGLHRAMKEMGLHNIDQIA